MGDVLEHELLLKAAENIKPLTVYHRHGDSKYVPKAADNVLFSLRDSLGSPPHALRDACVIQTIDSGKVWAHRREEHR